MAARPYLMPIDMTGNQVLNAVIHNLASAPSGPIAGRYYYDTGSNRFLYYNGSAFVNLATDSDKLGGQLPTYYLSRANQTGTQNSATISDLATTVQGYRLDQFAAPTASLNINGQRLTNVGTPASSTDGVTKAYVDALYQGQDPKPAANWATVAALPSNTYANGTAGVGATLTATANGVLTVDGGTPALNDRILVKNEATSAYWGLYVLTTLGTASVPYVLTRDTTMDQASEFGGAMIPVEAGGATNGNGLFLFTAAETITVGTTSLAVTKINASTALNGSTSILVSGGTISAIVAPSGGVLAGASGLSVDPAVVTRKFAQAIGDGSATSIVVTHNLGTQDVEVQLYQASAPYATVECDVQRTSVNTTTLVFSVAPTAGQYRVVIQG